MIGSEQRAHCAQYVLDEARWIIENFDPRPPGSDGEAALQHRLRDTFAAHSDGDVLLESFPVAQKAFMAVPATTAALVLLGAAAFWWSPWLALAFSTAAVLVLWFELIRYRRFTDRFFPKQLSHNVRARWRPRGEVKRRFVINGHPDAAYEWRLLYRFPQAFKLLVPLTVLALLLKLGFDVIFIFLGGWGGVHGNWGTFLGILQILLLPGAAVGLLYTDFRHVSPGANDNLTGTLIAAALARAFHTEGVRCEHTEVEFLVTGSEEAGLRGAKAHMLRHAQEYQDVETVFIAVDTIRELEHLKIYNRDLNGTVRHDEALCALLRRASEDVGLEAPWGTIHVGASDAAAFTQAGFKAAAICAMDPSPADYYHNRRDHWRNMDARAVEKTIDLLLAALVRYDRDGLSG